MSVISDKHYAIFSAFLAKAGCFIQKLITKQAVYHVNEDGLDMARFNFSVQVKQTLSFINTEYGGQAGVIVCLHELARPTQLPSLLNAFFGLYFPRKTVILLLRYC